MAKALRWPACIWRMIVGIAVLCASGLAAVPAQATGINEPTLWLYDLGTCVNGRCEIPVGGQLMSLSVDRGTIRNSV